MQFKNFFAKGLNKTLKLLNGTNFSYVGPWTTVGTASTVIDSWYVGEFMSADYTISVDHSTGTKEIIKCLLVASPSTAALTIYGRTDTGNQIINLTAVVNDSKLSLIATPILTSSKLIFSATYYQTLNPLVPHQG